jgi:hypothetical protein
MNVAANPIAVANASGYPLEAAIEAISKKWEAVTQWYVLKREHPWRHPETGDKRFLDLVLGGQQYDDLDHTLYRRRLVIECKRVEGSWVFPVSAEHAAQSNELRVLAAHPLAPPMRSWRKVRSGPQAYGSDACALSTKKGPVADALDRRTLEGWASDLISAAQALADQETAALSETGSPVGAALYIPLIVTTAVLTVLAFDPVNVDLQTGHVAPPPSSASHEVEWVRFSKDLGFEPLGPDPLAPVPSHERTQQGAWVVRATAFQSFLDQFSSLRVRGV